MQAPAFPQPPTASAQPAASLAWPATAYRLRSWPQLPDATRTAAVYRAFSRMSLGPVTLRWFAVRTGLPTRTVEALFDRLVDAGTLEKIDLTRFRDEPPAADTVTAPLAA